MKKSLLTLSTISILTFGFSQGSLILGMANIVIDSAATVYVTGDVEFNPNTTLYNNGTIRLENDWVNNSLTPAIAGTTQGLVILNGANQSITGSDVTNFYNLELQNSGSVKEAQINVTILNELNLNASVLETNQYLVHLQNPALTSLQWDGGFISGVDLQGYFLRSTNSTGSYSFPVGSNALIDNYRAIEILPTTTDSSVFGVRLGALDASLDLGTSAAGSTAPFSLSLKEDKLGELNNQYYHSIFRFFGNSEANARIYFFSSDVENTVTDVAKWSSTDGEWKGEDFSIGLPSNLMLTYNSPDKVATSKSILRYEDDVYVLSELELIFPTGFTPNGDGFNDVFIIENLELFPDNEIEIYNRWGEKIFAAKPYLNDWDGLNLSNGVKVQGKDVQEDTYFYILKLNDSMEPIKNYLELIRN